MDQFDPNSDVRPKIERRANSTLELEKDRKRDDNSNPLKKVKEMSESVKAQGRIPTSRIIEFIRRNSRPRG